MSDAPLALKGDAAPRASKSITFTPTNFSEAVTFAKMLSTSELVPKDYRGKHTNILVAMQMGAEVGLAPMQALQSIAVINGKPSVYGDAALAIVQSHPSYESHREWFEGEGEKKVAHCEVKRKNQPPSVQKFSVDDAKTAKLWKKEGPWTQYPDRMLQMRARGFALRDKFADALRGMILVEEAGDYTHNNSPARGEIARAELSTAQQLGTLSVSSEPNRGHGNEGTVRQQAQPEMCAECRQVNGHTADCPQAKKTQTKGNGKKPRDQWLTREGHDPKKHISFDDALQLFKLEKDLGISDEEMKAFLAKTLKIEHRHLIPQDKYQEVLGLMATQYGKNSAADENLDSEPDDDSESAEDAPRNTETDGLFDQKPKGMKDPG